MPCTVQLYLYFTQYVYSTAIPLLPSVPVQYSYTSTPLSALYSTAIPLLPSVPVQYSYTSTPLSTCTVQLYLYSPQYLYTTAKPLLPSVPVQYSCTSTHLRACTVQLYLYSPQCTLHFLPSYVSQHEGSAIRQVHRLSSLYNMYNFNQRHTQELCSGGGGFQEIQLRTEDRENGVVEGSSPPVRGSGGSCNSVQEISFHLVKFS